MRRGLTIAAAVAVLVAGAGTIYEREATVLPLFSRFGQDTGWTPEYARNARGQFFFLFEDQDTGLIGRWERHVADRMGETPGVVWVNGVPWKFLADGSVIGGTLTMPGLEVYTLTGEARAWVTPPLELSFSFMDSLGTMSGGLYLRFDDCTPDSATTIQARPDPMTEPLIEYRVKILQLNGGIWGTKVDDRVVTGRHFTQVLNPGEYMVYAAMIDGLGMEGHYVGPVHIMAGDCP